MELSSTHPRQPRVLVSLEIGRGIAALLVCAYHLAYIVYEYYGQYPLMNAFRAGHCGVEYFFVLSGFIIYYSHAKDLGNPSRLKPFALKRIIRIYPLYLLVFVPLVLAYLAVPSLTEKGELTPLSIAADALLLPHGKRMVLGVAWTLKHELLFYALFAISIIFKPARQYAIVAWMLAILAWNLAFWTVDTGPRGPIFLSTYNLGFGIGILVARQVLRAPPRRPLALLIAGVAAFVGLMAYEWAIGRAMPHDDIPLGAKLSPILYTVAAGLVIWGGAGLDFKGLLKPARWTALVGGASYALYLIHAPASSFLVRLLRATKLPLSPEAAFMVMMTAVIAMSVLLHLYIEKPCLAWLKARLLAKPAPAREVKPAYET